MSQNRLSPLVTVLLLIGAAVMLMPMLWTLLLSFKSNAALMADSGSAFAPPWTLENYRAIVAGSLATRWLVGSLIVSAGATIGVLVLSSLAGYGFARLEFPFRCTLFVIVLLGLAAPEQAVILPRHQLFAMLGLHNSYPGLILPILTADPHCRASLPSLTGSFGVFFMTQYFRAIPPELDEAALLDGASRLALFWKVLLPLTWPVQAVFASIPILVVYIAFQKQIVSAMAGTAVR